MDMVLICLMFAFVCCRSTDFIVEEVDPEGRVVEYSADCVYADPDLERKRPQKEEPEVLEKEGGEEEEEDDDKILEELTSLFEDSEFAESVLSLSKMPVSSTNASSQVVQNRVIEDKEHRKRIHMYFKCHFGGNLVTDVVAPSNFFRVSLKRKTGTARPSQYDHRNNQGPNDPKPVPFLEFSLWKDGLDTMEAVQILSKRLLMPAKSFSYAGTKDRRSVSVQRIVARNAFPAKISGVNKMTGMRMKVSHLQAVQGPLRFGDLSGNRFTIILRNCSFDEETVDFGEIAATLSEKGFINYYGLQRFGRGGGEFSTDAIGRALLTGNFELACGMILDPRPNESNKSIAAARTLWKETRDPIKSLAAFPYRCSAERAILQHLSKPGHATDFPGAIASINRELRLMYLHAVQSLWWNAAASKRAQLYGVDSCVVGDLVLDPVTGNVVLVCDENASQFSVSHVVIPIIGHASSLQWPQNDLGPFIKQFTTDTPEILERDSKWKHLWDLPGGYRHFIQKPKSGFEMQLFGYDESSVDEPLSVGQTGSLKAIQLRFTLPTSAYATMLLREIFPKESSTSGDYHKSIETS